MNAKTKARLLTMIINLLKAFVIFRNPRLIYLKNIMILEERVNFIKFNDFFTKICRIKIY